MSTAPDLFRARLVNLVDQRHPLAVLATRMPWAPLETAMTPLLARKSAVAGSAAGEDLFGPVPTAPVAASGPAIATGRPRLPVRLMLSLLYLKHAYNLSDEALVERWAENVYWQFFSGMEYFEPRLPCDATQVGQPGGDDVGNPLAFQDRQFTENTKLTVGAANIFDVFPTRQDSNETDNGFRYESVQFGLNGTAYFIRLASNF